MSRAFNKFAMLFRAHLLLARLRRRPRPKPGQFPSREQVCLFPTRPVLYPGFDQTSLTEAVRTLQLLLMEKKLLPAAAPSGQYDPQTEAAVREFQRSHHLRVDGIVGAFTWAALYYPRLSFSEEKLSEVQHQVKELQLLLQQEHLPITVNGHFDAQTKRALKRFQRRYGLFPDGVCGPMTWAVLLGHRESPDRKVAMGFLLPFSPETQLVEQVLMMVSVSAGIYLSGADPKPITEMVGIAYMLTYAVPLLLSQLQLKQPLQGQPWFLKFAPYLLSGYLWESVLTRIKAVLAG